MFLHDQVMKFSIYSHDQWTQPEREINRKGASKKAVMTTGHFKILFKSCRACKVVNKSCEALSPTKLKSALNNFLLHTFSIILISSCQAEAPLKEPKLICLVYIYAQMNVSVCNFLLQFFFHSCCHIL